jgi:uncharacterized protein (DUF2384 family)
MAKKPYADQDLIDDLPSTVRESEMLDILYNQKIGWGHVVAIKTLSGASDEVIAEWLHVSPKTLREYRKPSAMIGKNIKEHVLALLALFKHGVAVFGDGPVFECWLDTENYFFDQRKPSHFLDTITGIKYVDHRITAMEFGDNV